MFKESFKYYKSKNLPPNLDEVLDFNNNKSLLDKSFIKCFDLHQSDNIPRYGLKKSNEWEVYTINSHKGLIFIKNPFSLSGQRYWIKRCLKEYSKKPNKLNIDQFNTIPTNSEWWDVGQIDNKILMSLRWATLGYHHNWDTKIYSEENRNMFPEDLKDITEFIAHILGFSDFSAEAAIVNYYHLDSTLSGHTDHSEQNLEAPLFSFSFGQSAIFLIGGELLEQKPTAMFLHSGDVLIMSKESRLCYHGVPKIIKSNYEVWNDENKYEFENGKFSITKDESWTPFSNYLNHSRINMNVRQVLNIGQVKLKAELS